MHNCPTCGAAGEVYVGSVHGAQAHWFQRALWFLHLFRNALEKGNRPVLAGEVSAVIHLLEEVAERMLEENGDN